MTQFIDDTNNQKRQLFLNWVIAALIAVVVIATFYRTVFGSQSISRVYQLGQRDTLFARYSTPVREGYDASVYQYFVPSHVFLSEQLRRGVIPFWNPLVGCGEPFLADVETAVAWPLRIALLFLPPLRSWNLLIVANVLNFALGTFLLSRALALRRFAVLYASLTCAFCPYLIFQSELIGSSASMIPLVMASFVRAQASRKFLARALAGLACAVMIVSGHPEPSFFGIACASVLYLLLALSDKTKGSSAGLRLWFSLLDIGIIGAFAFCFSAFMLLPFFELLKNSDCYKLGLTGHREGVPLNSILINLIHPAYGNSSPFLGVLAVPLIFAGLWYGFAGNRFVRALAICSLLFLAIMSQVGPIDLVMNSQLFSWFVPKYCWPSLIVMLTVLSAFGFQYLADEMKKDWRTAAKCVTIGCLFVIICLTAIHIYPSLLEAARQDEAFEHMQVISKYFTRDIILLTAFSITFLVARFLGKAQAAVCVLAVAICTVTTLVPLVKQACPAGRSFSYDRVEPIPFLEQHGDRIVTMGRHVFCPSSNFCYGIDNFVPVNVYHPRRFQNFLSASGITPEGVNEFFDGRLTAMPDLAAVKYVVTPQPVLSDPEALPEPGELAQTISWGEDNMLRLSGAALCLYPENRELLGTLRFQVPSERARDLGLQPVLFDDKNSTLWLGEIDRILYLFSKTDRNQGILTLQKDLCVSLPKQAGKVKLALQVFDWKNGKYLQTNNLQTSEKARAKQMAQIAPAMLVAREAKEGALYSPQNEISFVLASCDSAGRLESDAVRSCKTLTSTRRFRLCQESASHVRVYENTHALQQAYLCHSCRLARNGADSLRIIQSSSFNPQREVVLESGALSLVSGADQGLIESARHSAGRTPAADKDELVFHRTNCNRISIDVDAAAPSLLVLTETYYPGWNAAISQGTVWKKAKIMRANYLFQAVLVPAGKSTVVFEFQPGGFLPGILLFALAAVTLLVAAFWGRLRRRLSFLTKRRLVE
jgi:hypothetical protein